MAGECIKMRLELHDSPKVGKIARLTGLDRFGVVGRLHRVWGWVDQTSEDGAKVDGEFADIDELADCAGFANAMAQVGWLQDLGGVLRFGNFTEHNGNTARRRAEDARRKGKGRKAPRPQTVRNGADTVRKPVGPSVELEQEQEAEQEKNPSDSFPPTPLAGGEADGTGSFDAWWASYPIRQPGVPRGNRKAAWKAWVKLGEADRARVVEATARLVASGQIPKDAERFIRPGPGGADPPWRAWLDDAPGAKVAQPKTPQTAAQRREEGNYAYDIDGALAMLTDTR